MMLKWWMLAALATCAIGADPTCKRGIKSADNKFCCARTCGKCGGIGCNARKGGDSACCTSGITITGRMCDKKDAPCQLRKPPSKPTPVPGKPAGNVKRPTSLGMHAGSGISIFERNRMYKTELDSLIMYQRIQYLNWDWIKTNLDAGVQVTLIIEFYDDYPNLQDIAGGKYDAQLKAFANEAKDDGRFFKARPLHEFNGLWYSWGIYRGGSNSVSAFKAAFRHVVKLLKSFDLNARYQLSYNCKTVPVSSPDSMESMYPGDDTVDEICVSAYNFAGTDRWHTETDSISTIITPWYEAMSFNDKPLCIAEMSSTDSKGQKSAWIKETWNSLARDFPRIQSIFWFLENKANHDFDLNTESQKTAFRDGFYSFKSITGGIKAVGDVSNAAYDPLASSVSTDRSTSTSESSYQKELEIEAELAAKRYELELKKRGLDMPDRRK